VVANGVGTTGDGELEGTTIDVETLDEAGADLELEVDGGATPITIRNQCLQLIPGILQIQHTSRRSSNDSPNGGATASRLRSRPSSQQQISLHMKSFMGMTTSSMMIPCTNTRRNRRSNSQNSRLHPRKSSN
jgi:hypothetical protein